MSHLSDALTRREQLRIAAVSLAGARVAGVPGNAALFQEADAIFGWLVRPETTRIKATTQVLRDGDVIWVGQVTVTEPGGNALMTAMQDTDTATITIEPEDSMSEPTGDSLTITQSDGGTPTTGGATATPGSAANVTYDVADGVTTVTLAPVAGGSLGDVTVTVDDPSAPSVAAFVNTFTISASATQSLVGTVTVNTGANTPPAPPAT
jgi:hypothetical protein